MTSADGQVACEFFTWLKRSTNGISMICKWPLRIEEFTSTRFKIPRPFQGDLCKFLEPVETFVQQRARNGTEPLGCPKSLFRFMSEVIDAQYLLFYIISRIYV